MEQAGIPVRGHRRAGDDEHQDTVRYPDRPPVLHTAEIGTYVVEGHVPANAVLRLLAEAPAVRGHAVPGMPSGSPGMEGGPEETYEVLLFGTAGSRSFGRYRGSRAL
ncbi:DUF411 domain-containing protein [Rhodoplanes azumiensis]|uniref:DUF411 domain-containing protein n=1 Tax=Rhodoplanes azumiensis TaxID=1897628 RepID=A0ABW5AI17_9BRAD